MKKYFLVILTVLAVVTLSYLFWPNFSKLRQLYKKNKILAEKIDQLEQQNLTLRRKIDALRNDPVYLEKVAREELSMSQSDEIIYKFKSDE